MNKEPAKLLYREAEKIAANEQASPKGRVEALNRLLNLLFMESVRKQRLQFTTHFARIAYVSHQFGLSKKLQFYIHAFRRQARAVEEISLKDSADQLIVLGLKVVAESLQALSDLPIPDSLKKDLPEGWPFRFSPVVVQSFIPRVRVVVLSDEEEHRQLLVKDEKRPEELIRVQYHLPERNENFDKTIDIIRKVFGFPLVLNLLDVEVDSAGIYRPMAFVIEPDFLTDVSAISECFKNFGSDPFLYLLKKYLPFTPSAALMLGNIANFFLDELMSNPEAQFRVIFPKIFAQYPLVFCLFSDREIKDIMQKSQKHFVNLKRVILQDFKEQGINSRDCYLEPSFYSEVYGLQGRLDVFHRTTGEKNRSSIVELKSGKAFMPNIHGISANHFMQTLLYDLMVRSVFGKQEDPANYILYSGADQRQLRFAPRIKSQQYEALQLRNHLVAIEWLLSQMGQSEDKDILKQGQRLFGRLRTANFPHFKGFMERDLRLFEGAFAKMSELDKKYFIAFSGFIAREHHLAKTGLQGAENINGLAALWLNSFEEKNENFEIINHIQVRQNSAGMEEPLIIFAKTGKTNPLANFRKGDIAVLYPNSGKTDAVLTNQIFKGTIIALTDAEVIVRLRFRQFNSALFDKIEYWNIEHDQLDSSFIGMYRGLFAFAQSPEHKKALLLTTAPPQNGEKISFPALPNGMTSEQQEVFKKMIASKDYFLLWGPPGTGKTSVMLRNVVKYLLENSQENLLLLAYTNRAVDEICQAIESIGLSTQKAYLRIGSRYSTDQKYQEQLLSVQSGQLQSRKQLKALIDGHRLIVSTVASISGKPEMLKLKKFQRVIIDEASQIPEPMLVGLLPQFERFVLIGDHKQLPAVVQQAPDQSAINDEALHGIGLTNLRNSLFERLYRRCEKMSWNHAFSRLSHQGRMHEDIMAFPNQHFYGDFLKILPPELSVSKKQQAAITFTAATDANELTQRLCKKRVLFLPCPSDDDALNLKVNRHEAELAAELSQSFIHLFEKAGKKIEKDSIGIITPYRAQIAQIRSVLEKKGIQPDLLTVDTVERYQGGARDVIIISLCTNNERQLESLVSLSEDGVDRKLNVAMTRAREHLIILGNPEILKYSPVYWELLKFCEVKQ